MVYPRTIVASIHVRVMRAACGAAATDPTYLNGDDGEHANRSGRSCNFLLCCSAQLPMTVEACSASLRGRVLHICP